MYISPNKKVRVKKYAKIYIINIILVRIESEMLGSCCHSTWIKRAKEEKKLTILECKIDFILV